MAARILYHGYWDHTVAALLKRTPALTCYSISRALETTLPAPPSDPRLLRWTPFGGCHSLSQSRSCVSTRHYSSLCSRNLAVPPWGSSSAKTFPPYSLLPTRNYISHSTYSNHLTYCARGYLHDPLSGVASQTRTYASRSNPWKAANRSTTTYIIALSIAVLGLAYAAVPLYRLFCQASGYGGTVLVADASEKIENMQPLRERELTIEFNSDTSAAMQWQFKPQQRAIKLVPGETALAFYTARNPMDKPVTGIATYNVIPFEAGPYFNKIQCFCFEEQRLNPNEQVDMPVFFYIDPEINEDPAMAKVDTIILSYTFFEAKEGESIYLPVPKQTL